jgi:hypothetical protein
VAVEAFLEDGRQPLGRLGRDDREPDVRQRGGGGHEPGRGLQQERGDEGSDYHNWTLPAGDGFRPRATARFRG